MNGWIELKVWYQSDLATIYGAADRVGVESIHHFIDEPWWPGRPIVRIKASHAKQRALLTELGDGMALGYGVASWCPIDMADDERLFGDSFEEVMDFFEAASRVGLVVPRDQHAKLVHCALNAWNYTVKDEARFHAWSLKRRRWMLRHDRRWSMPDKRGKACRYGCHPRAYA